MCQYCLCQEPLQHRVLWAREATTTLIVMVSLSMVVNTEGDSSFYCDSSSSVKTSTAVSASATHAVDMLFCASFVTLVGSFDLVKSTSSKPPSPRVFGRCLDICRLKLNS